MVGRIDGRPGARPINRARSNAQGPPVPFVAASDRALLLLPEPAPPPSGGAGSSRFPMSLHGDSDALASRTVASRDDAIHAIYDVVHDLLATGEHKDPDS